MNDLDLMRARELEAATLRLKELSIINENIRNLRTTDADVAKSHSQNLADIAIQAIKARPDRDRFEAGVVQQTPTSSYRSYIYYRFS